MSDFFSSVAGLQSITQSEHVSDFSDAVAKRFNHTTVDKDHNLLSPRLFQTPVSDIQQHFPTVNRPIISRNYTPIGPSQLQDYVDNPDGLLVLDLRPPAAHIKSHLIHSISLSVPSTLLKRPAFPIRRLAAMLPTQTTRDALSDWPKCSRIIVYDAEGDEALVLALLDKFQREGFDGQLCYLKGGFQVLRHSKLLRQSSSIDAQSVSSIPEAAPSKNPSNPFFDAVRQNTELAQGITVRIPLRLKSSVRDRATAEPLLPSWISKLASDALPLPSETDPSPSSSLKNDQADALALQFHRIELAEQRRMQGVMAHHARESQVHTSESSQTSRNHPFSISAGVEKGAKNRYRHIWPFEHARVRLVSPADVADDYVNASHVRPLGTSKEYIATQGPLSATVPDFWLMIWEQKVNVIVMLTREIENAQLKCERYWPTEVANTTPSETYGHITVTLLSSTYNPVTVPDSANSFFANASKSQEEETITRILLLRHDKSGQTRKITHLQHIAWPDMDVPHSPTGIIQLVNTANDAIRANAASSESKEPVPLLLHCSAGVGRTGGFIAVDAVLDMIRADVRAALFVRSKKGSPMNVDGPSSLSQPDPQTPSAILSPATSPPTSPPPMPRSAVKATQAWANDTFPHPMNFQESSRLNKTWQESQQRQPVFSPEPRSASLPVPKTTSSELKPSILGSAFTHSPAPTTTSKAISVPGTTAHFGSDIAAIGSDTYNASSLDVSTQDDSASPPPSTAKEESSGLVELPNISAQGSRSTATETDHFDYALPPRTGPGPDVSKMDHPIFSVVQDMREQRMSLCQSLRQYVFVHAVVIEGALDIVAEEIKKQASYFETANAEGHTIGSKRNASPTELQDDRDSEYALTKRLSVKRKDPKHTIKAQDSVGSLTSLTLSDSQPKLTHS